MRRMAGRSSGAVRWRTSRIAEAGRRPRRARAVPARTRRELQQSRAADAQFFSGATCAGVLLQRLRLHLRTQRFLAAKRGDRIWEASCDYAALSLESLIARLRPGMFEQPLAAARPDGGR